MKACFYLIFLLFLTGCKQNNSTSAEKINPPKVLSFSQNIEEAHNKPAFRNHEAVAFHINLKFGGKTRLDADISMSTNSEKVRLDKEDGSSLIFDGQNVYLSPQTAKEEDARFDIFTWQYFFSLPFKLTDPGTVWDKKRERQLDGKNYKTARLSFMANTGDSPDDWYIIYKDEETNRLKAAAYIVTFSSSKEKAEENPHLIKYSDYKMIEEVAFATTWKFYNWNEEKGLGEQLGEAKITDIHFFEPQEKLFKRPASAKIVKR